MSAGDLALALSGFSFLPNPRMVTGVLLRRPRSKRYRIRKKWAKRPGNMRHEPIPQLFYHQEAKVVIGHPDAIDALKRRIIESAEAGIKVHAACNPDNTRLAKLTAMRDRFVAMFAEQPNSLKG